MKIRDLINNDNKKETKGKSRIRDLVQSGYDSLGSNKYDEEERKEAEGDGSLSPFSSYRTANRERAEAALPRDPLRSSARATSAYDLALKMIQDDEDYRNSPLGLGGVNANQHSWNTTMKSIYANAGLKNNKETIDSKLGAGATDTLRSAVNSAAIGAQRNAYAQNRKSEINRLRRQFKSDDEFNDYLEGIAIGWTNGQYDPERSEFRKQRRDRQESKINDITAELENIDKAYYDPTYEGYIGNADADQFAALEARRNELMDERERLEADINKYDRFQAPLDRYAGSGLEAKAEEYKRTHPNDELTLALAGNTGSANAVNRGYGTYNDPMIGAKSGKQKVVEQTFGLNLESHPELNEITPEELNVYYGLAATYGEDYAKRWVSSLSNVLGMRRSDEYQQNLKEANTIERILLTAAQTPQRLASRTLAGAEDLANMFTGKGVNPYTGANLAMKQSEATIGAAAEGLDNDLKFNILGQTPGKIYQGIVSGIDSFAQMMIGQVFGSAHLGEMGMALGAGAAEAAEMWEKGVGNDTVLARSILAGTFEALFEHMSIEKFTQNFLESPITGWADIAKKTGVQVLTEGSEEVFTDGANFLSDLIHLRSQSEWTEMFNKYKAKGYSDGDAIVQSLLEEGSNLFDSFMGGVYGALLSSGAGAASAVKDKIANEAETRQIGADITEANKGRALSKQALDIAASGNVDAKTAKALEKAAEAYDKKNNNKRAGKLFRAVTDAVNEGITDAEAQETAAGKVAAVLVGDGVDYVKASDPETGDAVTVDRAAPIARTEDGNVYMNTDRGEVALEDLAFEDDAVRDMIYSISEYGPEYANMILTNYGGEDVGTYLGGMREGILTGQYGDLGEELYDFNSLSRADQNLALKIGQSIRADQVAAKAEAAKAARLSELNVRGRDLVRQDMKIEGVKAGRGASGRVGQLYFDQGVKVESDLDRANADFAKLVSLVYGNDIVIFDSLQNPELRNKNGMHVGSDGSIWVDIKAGEARQGLVAYALSHEMTHEAAQWAPEAYRAFTDFLVSNYAEQGVSVRQLVSKKMADMGTDSFDAAFDEVIADACERFLLDSNAIEKLNEMRKTDRTTFEKIRDFIKSAIAKLKAALQSLKTAGRLEGTEASEAFRNSATGEQIEELEKKIGQLEDAWSLVLMEAAENRAKANENSELGMRNAESKTDVKYSERLTKDDYARYMELAKDPEKNEAELSRMVEAAAREGGYDSPKLYHGTQAFGFTQFRNTIFATSAPWIAETYARGLRTENYKSSLKNAVNYTDAFKLSSEELLKAAKDSLGWKYWGLEIANAKDAAEDTVYKYHTGRDFFIKGSELAKELNDTVFNGVYQLFGKLGRSLTINAQGRYFDDIKIGNKTTSTDKIVESAFKSGYDSVVIKNVFDAKGEKTRSGDVYAFRNNSDVKSAEPVVYDGNGNVIPLSERFNEERDDIRYSTRTEAAEAQTGAEEEKTERETAGVFASTRTGTSTSTRAVVERALETLKDGPEKTALTAYKNLIDQYDEQRRIYETARREGDSGAEAQAKGAMDTIAARLRQMENAPALQNVAAVSDITALNRDVRNLSRMLRLQGRETKGKIALKSSIEAAASDLMKEHGIRRGKAELVDLLTNFYTYLAYARVNSESSESLNREFMLSAAEPVADWLVRTAPVASEIDQNVEATLKELKGAKIRVNDQQRGDIENKYGDYNKWRKSLYPYVIVTSDPSAMTLDSLWDELSEAHPEFFDPEISWGDQGVALRDVLSDLKSRRVTKYYIGDEAYGWLRDAAANDVVEAFWKIKPYETIADKYAKEIEELKAAHKKTLLEQRSVDQMIKEEREKIWRRGYEVAQKRHERRELKRRIRSLTENMSNRLIKPKVNKYIPESLQAATAAVLDAIDLDTGRSQSLTEKFQTLKSQYQKIIEREKAAQGNSEQQEGRYAITTDDETVNEMFRRVIDRIKGTAVKDMTVEQLGTVYEALRTFDHVVRDSVNAASMNTILDEKMTVQDIGERLIEESEATKERKGAIARYFNWQMRPEEFFESLAGYKKNSMWHRVYQMLDRAQRQQIMYEMQGNEIFRDVLKDQKYVRSLSRRGEGDLVDIGLKDAKENPYKITRGMMLSIWKHLQNEENMRHIMIGGLVAPDLKKYYDGKTENVYNEKENRIFGVIGAELASAYKRIEKKISDLDDRWEAAEIRGDNEAMDQLKAEQDAAWAERDDILERGRAIMDQIRKNIEALLTEQDRAFLAASDKFFDEFSRGILNDATRRMYGFEKAKVENYFPIHVSSAFLGANFESIKRDFSVEGSGFMKDRVQSSKPIMLEDFGAVIDRQISNVAKYAALAPALKDFSKIYSVIRGGAEFETSVGKTISERFGDQGVKYLENLIADLNGARSREASPFDRLRSRGAGAVLTLNPRVSMVQAASYVTAASELGYGPLARALVNPEGHAVIVKRAPKELIKKYSGMLWTRKEKGNIDAAVAATRSLGNKRTLAESKLKFLTGWIEAVDAGTVGRLWYASEYYVQKKNPDMKGYKTSKDQKKIDQYYMKVADVFSNVIERTQPNYTVMQRPAVLRSTNAMVKALTMFMTQRLQNANILYSATRRWAKYSADYKAGINGVTREDVREARAGFVNAVTSQMISAATISAMRLVADMLLRNMKGRRDEDDEITRESVRWSLLNDFLSSAVSNFVGGSETYELVRSIMSGGRYYGISAGGLDQVNDLLTGFSEIVKHIAGGKLKGKDFLTIATNLGNISGIPVANAYKILKAIKGVGEALVNEEAYKRAWFEYGTGEIWESGPIERTKKQKGNLMLKAYREGNKERYREIQGQFNDTADATARENADAALLDAVYEEWKTGAIDDREALDILEDCLAKPPKTENDERMQIGRWETKKANEDIPKGEKETYGAMKDLRESFAAYVYPAPGTDRASTGAAAKAMIKQYREWGYDENQIRKAIFETFKNQYVTLKPSEQREMKRYIVKLYSFTKDNNGDSYDASEIIDDWKKTDAQIAAEKAAEEEDEREWG